MRKLIVLLVVMLSCGGTAVADCRRVDSNLYRVVIPEGECGPDILCLTTGSSLAVIGGGCTCPQTLIVDKAKLRRMQERGVKIDFIEDFYVSEVCMGREDCDE